MIEYKNIGSLAFLGDLHFGVKNDNSVFLEHSLDFLERKFFPWLVENNITHVIQFGDLMDKRKSVNIDTLAAVKTRFFKSFEDNGITLHILIGNHDVYYKSTNDICSVVELFSEYSNVILYNEPTEVKFDGVEFLIIPWITHDNYDDIFKMIENTTAEYCLGHLELSGFEFAKGIMSLHGTEAKAFQKFKHVWSGHYHTSSTIGNITYLGTPYEITWSDYDDIKCVFNFDLDSQIIESKSLNERMFCFIDWSEELSAEWKANKSIDIRALYNVAQGCSYKIVVNEEKWNVDIDSFIRWLDVEWNPSKIVVVDVYNIISEDIDIDSINISSTIDLLYKAVEDLPRADELNVIVKDVYEQALIEQATGYE